MAKDLEQGSDSNHWEVEGFLFHCELTVWSYTGAFFNSYSHVCECWLKKWNADNIWFCFSELPFSSSIWFWWECHSKGPSPLLQGIQMTQTGQSWEFIVDTVGATVGSPLLASACPLPLWGHSILKGKEIQKTAPLPEEAGGNNPAVQFMFQSSPKYQAKLGLQLGLHLCLVSSTDLSWFPHSLIDFPESEPWLIKCSWIPLSGSASRMPTLRPI